MAKKSTLTKGQRKSMTTQQIFMGVIGVIIVLTMVLSLLKLN